MPKNKLTGERTKPGPGRPGRPNLVKAVGKRNRPSGVASPGRPRPRTDRGYR